MTEVRKVSCDMKKDCRDPITHLDLKGYVYCTKHGVQRRRDQPCRKLRSWELNRIMRSGTLNRY